MAILCQHVSLHVPHAITSSSMVSLYTHSIPCPSSFPISPYIYPSCHYGHPYQSVSIFVDTCPSMPPRIVLCMYLHTNQSRYQYPCHPMTIVSSCDHPCHSMLSHPQISSSDHILFILSDVHPRHSMLSYFLMSSYAPHLIPRPSKSSHICLCCTISPVVFHVYPLCCLMA